MGKTTTIARSGGVCAVCGKPWKDRALVQKVQSGWSHIECARAYNKAQAQLKATKTTKVATPQKREVRPAQFYWVVNAELAEPEDSPWKRSSYRTRVHVFHAKTGDPLTCVVRVLDGWAIGREFVTSVASLQPIPPRQNSAAGKRAEQQRRLEDAAHQRRARAEYRQKYPSQISDYMSAAKARYWAKQNAPDQGVTGPVKTGDPRRGSPGSLHGEGLGISAQWGKGRRRTVIHRTKQEK